MCIFFSSRLDKTGKTDMGRKFSGNFLDSDLYTGIALSIFHFEGTAAVSIDKFGTDHRMDQLYTP